jgi:hypothetical protein
MSEHTEQHEMLAWQLRRAQKRLAEVEARLRNIGRGKGQPL